MSDERPTGGPTDGNVGEGADDTVAEQPADQGYLTEALMSAIVQSAPEAKERVRAFLEGRASKVSKG